MEQLNVFLAVPISSCANVDEYDKLRRAIMDLLGTLRGKGFQVFSEVEQIVDESGYEPPGDTVKKDFGKIDQSHVFILFHPRKMQSSTLIELGYAYAKEKKIIIISRRDDLPYMACGFPDARDNTTIIESETLDTATISKIINLLNE